MFDLIYNLSVRKLKENMKAIQEIYKELMIYPKIQQELINSHKQEYLEKKTIILKPGEILDGYYVVENGIVRAYVKNSQNEEITTDFFMKNEIVIDVVSLFRQQQSELFLQTVTEASLYKIQIQDFNELYRKYPEVSEWGRSWMTNQLFDLRARITFMAAKNAVERYNYLLQQKPELFLYVPLKYIASYIGVTETSLSRLRRRN